MGEQNDFASFVDQLNDSWGDTFDTGPIGDLAAYDRYVEVHAYQHAFVLDISVVKRRKRSHARLSRRRHQQYQSWQSYSITSLATASTFCGMVRPSALAVFRLMTKSNLVVCSTSSHIHLTTCNANLAAHVLLQSGQDQKPSTGEETVLCQPSPHPPRYSGGAHARRTHRTSRRELIAKRIIRMAQSGEVDPEF